MSVSVSARTPGSVRSTKAAVHGKHLPRDVPGLRD